MSHFAVTTRRGPAWDEGRGIREQDGWDKHAAFMDALVEDGFVILGGPVGDGSDGRTALMLVEAESEEEVHERMAPDPWAAMDVLHVGSVEPWRRLWMDGR